MAKRKATTEDTPSLWRVVSFGQEFQSPADRWFYNNRDRRPSDIVVFQYTLGGCMIYRDHTGTHRVAVNDAALFQYNEDSQYGLDPDSPARFSTQWLGLRGAGLGEHIASIRHRFGSIFQFGRDHAVRDAMRQLMDLADPRHAADPLVMAERVHQFVMRLMRHAHQTQQRALSPAERAIDDLLRYPLSVWSLKELAQRHGVSREHLARIFTQRHRQTPAAFIAGKRLAHAVELLQQTSLPVAAIARQAGYGTTHTLCRQVRCATGRSPRQLRTPAQGTLQSHDGL